MLAITEATGHTSRLFIRELEKNNYTDEIRCFVKNEVNAVCL